MISELSLKNKVNEAIVHLEKENSALTNSIEKIRLEHSINEKLIEEKYKSKINERDLTIQELREMKSKLSTKMVGETLEIIAKPNSTLIALRHLKTHILKKIMMPLLEVKVTIFLENLMKTKLKSFP